MKKMMTLMVMLTITATMFAKDIKTVVFTTLPQMQCENCENKIKGNMKFEKGVKEINTNISEQKVTIKYDAAKTTPEKLAEGFTKFGYKATEVNAEGTTTTKKGGCSCCAAKKEEAEAAGSCCSAKGEAPKVAGGCCGGKTEAKPTAGSCCSDKKDTAKKDGGCCKK